MPSSRLRDRLGKLAGVKLLGGTRLSAELERLQRQLERLRTDATDEEIWRSVELARHQDRPYTLDYVERILDDWFELHGDRGRTDDHAVVAGLGKLDGRTVARRRPPEGSRHQGADARNFGMAYPEGYRKAMRVMELAERHGFPLLALVDTPGAYPGVAAEQHGQGGAIARSQAAMVRLAVPTVAVVIGEGGSGGAVALAVADRVLMQENAIYSVISPEGCAAILWRDASQAQKAASAFKPDAAHCLELGVIDGIVPEPAGGAHADPDAAAALLRDAIAAHLDELDERRRSTTSPRPAREVPRDGRPRVEHSCEAPVRRRTSPHFPQAYPRVEIGLMQGIHGQCECSVKGSRPGGRWNHGPRWRYATTDASAIPAATPEPFGARRSGSKPLFVVQRHAARRAALRLPARAGRGARQLGRAEGDPARAGQRHLAVHVEDHPLDYADFEGEIPAGQYGAGTVEIWDRGTYELLEEKRNGGLTVRLDGERLQGVWTLVPARLDGNPKNWLLLRKDAPCVRRRAHARRCWPRRPTRSRRARAGCTSRSGTAFARSRRSPAARRP